MSGMFSNCFKYLKALDLSNFDTSNVEDMSGMFNNSGLLRSIKGIEGFNTSKVEDMESTFYGCSALTADCSKWDVSKVTEHARFNENASGVTAPNWVN